MYICIVQEAKQRLEKLPKVSPSSTPSGSGSVGVTQELITAAQVARIIAKIKKGDTK